MHGGEDHCSSDDEEAVQPPEKKVKLEEQTGKVKNYPAPVPRREHPVSRSTRVMEATLFSNPPQIAHLELDQTDVDDLVGGEMAWNEFRRKYLKNDDEILYARHYR